MKRKQLKLILAFPKLIICLNSQQSMAKIETYYPEKNSLIQSSLPFLYGSYGDNHGEHFRDFMKRDRSLLDEINIEDFFKQTKPDISIIACKYINSGKNSIFIWKLKKIYLIF